MPDNPHPPDDEPAQPPAGGRQDHEAMRAASLWPVTGPASSDVLAASGGLNLPGNEPEHQVVAEPAPVPEPIPGERDPSALTHRQPGAMTTAFNAGVPQPATSTLTDDDLHDRLLEGGGQAHDHRDHHHHKR